MTVMEAIKERHVARAFLNKPVETEKLEQIMEAGRIALLPVTNKTGN